MTIVELAALECLRKDLLACTYDGPLSEDERLREAHRLSVVVDEALAQKWKGERR